MAKEDKSLEQEQLLKSISDLLDETIKEVETLSKGEVNFSDLKLQPNEQGDMAGVAKQPSDDAAALKKEDEKLPEELKDKMEEKEEDKEEGEEKDDEEKPEVEKAIPEELNEAKDDEKKPEEDPKKDDEDEDEKEMDKFCKMLDKAMCRLGYVQKSEEESKEEVLEKSEEKPEEVKEEEKKENEEISTLKKSVEDLTKTVKELSARPVSGRKSLTGLAPIAKSAEDGVGSQPLAKSQVINKLLDLQKSGDKRVTPVLVTKFEQSGDMELVKGLV